MNQLIYDDESWETPDLQWAHPLVQTWFKVALGTPSEPQKQGWPSILAKKNTLISAPTGSGKTLSAFLVCIDELVRQSLKGELNQDTQILYVSPLKALVNDIQKNLLIPLSGIFNLAKEQALTMASIDVAIRTGDTSPYERQNMLKNPPHILVTTPESLYILLTAEKSRERLKTVKTVIVDEIHALLNDKRGAHLALSLARLDALTKLPPVRIGLSATQKPIETVAHFLVGNHMPQPNVIQIGHLKPFEIHVETTAAELSSVASNELWDEIYDRIAILINAHQSTLIFANTRRLAERAAHHLSERLGKESVLAHHGSLSRKIRINVEDKLKQGTIKAVVATASLELGIDIGAIDLVCQLGSPRSISVMLQRLGRAGHWKDAVSKGIIFATTRDELLECAALANTILQGELDKLIIPVEPLDVLAQQIVAIVATGDWLEEDLFHLITRAFHYENLTRKTFNEIIHMLTEGLGGARGRYGAYLFRDQIHGLVKARRGSRLTAMMNGGAIPENGLFSVLAEPNHALVGTLDEDFAVESNRGDVILLGSTSWKIKRVESSKLRVLVEDAHGAPPSVPFWRGEAPERSKELSKHVSLLRETLDKLLSENSETSKLTALNWLIDHCQVDKAGGEQIIDYILQGRSLLGVVPSQTCVIAERFFDESGGMQLIIHAPFGARINKAWGLALRKRFCKSFDIELQAAATDNGINISLTEQHSFPLQDVFHFLHAKTLKKVLTQAVLQSPIFTTRWRWDATRALAIPRFRGGKKVPPHILRMLSEDLLTVLFPDVIACQDNLAGKDMVVPDHPLVNEALKDALHEALDVEGLIKVIDDINQQKIQAIAIDTTTPSVFSHEILNANPYAFLDDAPLEERRARAVEMRRILPDDALHQLGKLDVTAIQEVRQQTWPDIRNSDELHDLLQTWVVYPSSYSNYQTKTKQWTPFFKELLESERACESTIDETVFWYTQEKKEAFKALYLNPSNENASKKMFLFDMVSGWMRYLGPITSKQLHGLLKIPQQEIEQTLLHLESTGFLLRGHFEEQKEEWCERRLLARIHKATLTTLRKEITAVPPLQFMHWLLHWQHIAPNTLLNGEQGLLEVIRQCQGFELPAKAWEKYIFKQRMQNYDPNLLDRLCLMGMVGWGRFSFKPKETYQRINATSMTPITFFIRQEASWLPELNDVSQIQLSHVAKNIHLFLKNHGASFFPDIVVGIKHLKSEVENGLWELVAAGLITADSFDNLRALIDRKRRLGKRRQSFYITGRWSLLTALPHTSTYLENICWILLKRYGVVFRDLLAREKISPTWRELLNTFRLLEVRGEIRGGRFVDGFLGEQFALPYAVESLRVFKKQFKTQETIQISAVDPLNLTGIILPGPRINTIVGEEVHFQFNV